MRKYARIIHIALLCALSLALTPLTGCSVSDGEAPVYPRFSMSFFDTFDTLITIVGHAPDEDTFKRTTEEAHALFQRLHKLYDGYNAYEGINNLHTLNREAAKGPVTVEPELMDLLLFCQEKQPLTCGAVNVALGAVLQIWHDYRETGLSDPFSAELPPMDALQRAAGHADMNDVLLDPVQRTVRFTDSELQLDLGAVAKGYATELVAQQMLASETPSFIINAGGNVRVGNQPLDGKRKAWGIGIQDPRGNVLSDASSDIKETFFVSNLSLVSSGDYQRYYFVAGERYHHLIDPATLMPGVHYQAVTVLCEDSGLADLLSTAVFLLPYEQSRELVGSLEGVDALWILPDGSVRMTDGAAQFAKSAGATSMIESQ